VEHHDILSCTGSFVRRVYSTATSNAWTATDPTGTGAGWHLTIASTDFTTDTIQRVDVGSATAGTFTLTYSSQTTASIAFDATAETN